MATCRPRQFPFCLSQLISSHDEEFEGQLKNKTMNEHKIKKKLQKTRKGERNQSNGGAVVTVRIKTTMRIIIIKIAEEVATGVVVVVDEQVE